MGMSIDPRRFFQPFFQPPSPFAPLLPRIHHFPSVKTLSSAVLFRIRASDSAVSPEEVVIDPSAPCPRSAFATVALSLSLNELDKAQRCNGVSSPSPTTRFVFAPLEINKSAASTCPEMI